MQKYVSCFSLFGSSVTNAPVVGNGVALGFTDNVSNFGMHTNTNTANPYAIIGIGDYGKNIGVIGSTSYITRGTTIGVTADPEYSGLIAKLSGLTLGTVPSEKLGNFCIRYQPYKREPP